MVNATPPAYYPVQKPGTHCTEYWVGPQGLFGRMRKISTPPGFFFVFTCTLYFVRTWFVLVALLFCLFVFTHKTQTSTPPAGFEPRTVQSVASRRTDYAIPPHDNFVYGDIKRKLHSRIACYGLVQNISSCSLLPKKLNIKIYEHVLLPAVCIEGRNGQS
jgi:hypothetical protein